MRDARREPKPITVREAIAVAPEAVWSVISTPGYLESSHPFCARHPVEVWPGADSVDRVEYYNGRVIERRFTGWIDGVGYDLEVFDANGRQASVSWRITSRDAGAMLSIALVPRMLDHLPPVRRGFQYAAVVRPMMRRYLRSVVRGVSWRVTTGQSVRRNQFGSHVWFSRRDTVNR